MAAPRPGPTRPCTWRSTRPRPISSTARAASASDDMVAAAAPQVVVMGVSGSGKGPRARPLAPRLGGNFLEGAALPPPRNVERMAAGVALTDDDRRDWLLAIAQRLADACAGRRSLVVSC